MKLDKSRGNASSRTVCQAGNLESTSHGFYERVTMSQRGALNEVD